MDPLLLALIGPQALAVDLTELDETDCLHAPQGAIAEAQALAAEAFGASETFFLVNGSTSGLHALVLSACRPDEAIALSRASHLSAFGALILAGVRPVFAGESWDDAWQLPGALCAQGAVAALGDPGVRALVVTRPDYFGRATDLAPIAEACHAHDRLLLVDEAHGAHLGLDPRLPEPALRLGADAVVQSTHKLLGALTQASMLHLGGTRLDPVRVRRMLRLLQTTSPSYLLMASLDAARRARVRTGARDWARTLDLAASARLRLLGHGIPTLGPDHGPSGDWDPAKLVVDLAGTGHDGFAVAEHLHARARVQVELATSRYVGAVVSPGNSEEDVSRLVDGLLVALGEPRAHATKLPALPPSGELVVLPRAAFLGESRRVSLERAHLEVSAELICPYPPGLPVVIPGERLTRQMLEYLQALRAAGASFVGPEDPTLETIQVCATTLCSSAIAASSS